MTTVMTWQNEQGPKTVVFPSWVPLNVGRYVAHTEFGAPIRALARSGGCHASTVLRQIRRVETRRDDPLIDAALRHLGETGQTDETVKPLKAAVKGHDQMNRNTPSNPALDGEALAGDFIRILRRLCEKGAVLAVAAEMEKAVVVRDGEGTTSARTAVVDRSVAETMALKGWINASTSGKITRYQITSKGRGALTGLMAQEESAGAMRLETPGFADATTGFDHHPRIRDGKEIPRNRRYSLAESPLTALARRRDKGGQPFLADELVHVGERLREDFELGQMGPKVTQNWDSFLTTHDQSHVSPSGPSTAPSDARARVAAALQDLGPGLADVALRCCCFLEGLETTEKRLGWSARSGKIVLRIALTRLHRHYAETKGNGGQLIG